MYTLWEYGFCNLSLRGLYRGNYHYHALLYIEGIIVNLLFGYNLEHQVVRLYESSDMKNRKMLCQCYVVRFQYYSQRLNLWNSWCLKIVPNYTRLTARATLVQFSNITDLWCKSLLHSQSYDYLYKYLWRSFRVNIPKFVLRRIIITTDTHL